MGIQIYIKKEALKERNLKMKSSTEVLYCTCKCGYEVAPDTVCEYCGSRTEPEHETFTSVEGLDLVMHDFQDSVWHDANHWGSSRTVIMEFIEKHKLKAGTDWYEA